MIRRRQVFLKELEDFAKQYFPKRHIIIKWKKMEHVGEASIQKYIIYLSPKISTNIIGCKVGSGIFYKPKTGLKLKQGEQYFLVLLHEIAHFKVKIIPPVEWIKLKRKLFREAKNRLKVEKEKAARFGLKQMTKKKEWQFICDCVNYDAALKIKKEEKEIDYQGRNEDFRNWLFGGAVSEHMNVEDWAIVQFRKKRSEIQNILTR